MSSGLDRKMLFFYWGRHNSLRVGMERFRVVVESGDRKRKWELEFDDFGQIS